MSKCLLHISKALRGYEFDTKFDLFLKHAIVDVAFFGDHTRAFF